MLKFKRLICAVSLMLIFLPCTIYGQAAQKKFSIKTDISFRDQSEPAEIKFPILTKGDYNIVVESKINQGELIIELYDPQGEKQGDFTIGSPAFSSKESVRGSISKRVINANKGEWIVKLIPKNASGAIEIECN